MVPAGVAKLADAPDLGSGAARRGGSSPFTRTLVIHSDRSPSAAVFCFLGNLTKSVKRLVIGQQSYLQCRHHERTNEFNFCDQEVG